ncbi:hypothetical protein MBLNU230_g5277t1 [Neophaeotheca triangularis]
MPGVTAANGAGAKRKRPNGDVANTNGTKPRKAPKSTKDEDSQAEILLLEEQILESRQHYNNIVELQKRVDSVDGNTKSAFLAAVALCRVFSRLIASEKIIKRKNASPADEQVVAWLKDCLSRYTGSLALWIGSEDASRESTALTLLMRVVKEEVSQEGLRGEQAWRTGVFQTLLETLILTDDAEAARQEFVDKYVEEHDDVRFYTYIAVKGALTRGDSMTESQAGNALDVLAQIEGVPDAEDQLEDWYGQEPAAKKHQLKSLNAHRKAAQEAWLALFRQPLTTAHRKRILNITTSHLLPWFPSNTEKLTDFLTDSFNAGGSTSLLALSGIFHLITAKNLDYPDFYPKLYSLLDANTMHSKHRSRFFRLLTLSLSSTHLPAILIASFLKRLARLALVAPPGAIVFTIPLTYNLLKTHPACTFMLHRPPHPAHSVYATNPEWATTGVSDPFNPLEPDPMRTNAIESSLWELVSLQRHYHPNVATLARIVSEQFTKREYSLEDFLDHGYAGLVEGELGRELKKAPVVEWEIPKRIVSADGEGERGGLNEMGRLLEGALGEL